MNKSTFERKLLRHNRLVEAAIKLESEIAAGQAKNGPWALIFRKVLALGPASLTDGEALSEADRQKWINDVRQWLTGKLKLDDVNASDITNAEGVVGIALAILRVILKLGARFIARVLVSCAYGTTPRGRVARLRRIISRLHNKLENNAAALGYRLEESSNGVLTAYTLADTTESLGSAEEEEDDSEVIDWAPGFADLAA